MTIAGPTEPSTQLFASVATFRVFEPPPYGQSPAQCQRKGVTQLCEGPLVISRTEGKELAYIHIGPFSRPLFPKSRVWRVSRSEIVLPQPTPGRYWLIGIDGAPRALERLRDILSGLCDYFEQPGLDHSMDEAPSLTFSDTSDQEHEKEEYDELNTVSKIPQTPDFRKEKNNNLPSPEEMDLSEALIPTPDMARYDEDEILLEPYHEALQPTPVSSPNSTVSSDTACSLRLTSDLPLLEPLDLPAPRRLWDKPRFTHPLIPNICQRAPIQRNTLMLGPQAFYPDVTTVSGFVAWRAMNRILKRH